MTNWPRCRSNLAICEVGGIGPPAIGCGVAMIGPFRTDALALAELAFGAVLLCSLCGTVPAHARDVHVSAVGNQVPIKCMIYNEGWFWFSTTTGPCLNFKAPPRIVLGSSFSEAGIEHTINVIIATQMETGIKAGEWYCAAAETEADLDTKGLQKRRAWLFIRKCAPLL